MMLNTAKAPSKPTTTSTTNPRRRATTGRLFSFNTYLPDTLVHYAPECVEGKFCELRDNGVLLSSFRECFRSEDRHRYRRFTCGRIFAGLTFPGFASRGASRLTLADHLPRRLETSMRFWSGSLQYTDDSGSVAPVRRTGPSRISTPFAPRCSTTSRS